MSAKRTPTIMDCPVVGPEQLRDEAIRINGFMVSPPERILAWKRGVNHQKDADDIAPIEQYLGS